MHLFCYDPSAIQMDASELACLTSLRNSRALETFKRGLMIAICA